jgi:hypothetical protein
MAFAIRNLSVLAYANGFTLRHYKASDNLAAVARSSYFRDAGDMLKPGDMIMVSAFDGARILVVGSADAGNVVTAPLA